MKPLDVIGFGEASVDHVYVVPQMLREGTSKLRIRSSFTSFGGQVATTMAACASLGLRTGYLGPLGNDDHGRGLRQALEQRGVDTSRIIVRQANTRYAVILVDGTDGDRVVLWDRDAVLDVPRAELPHALVQGTRVVHVDAVDESAAIHLARAARAAGAIVTCDVETATVRTPELLAAVTVPIMAPNVPRELTAIVDVEGALRAMRRQHAGLLCVTLGAGGAAALDGDAFLTAPAVHVAAVDTTGAGDVFRAGVIYGLLQEWAVPRILTFANAAAAVSCTRAGAIAAVPRLEEILSLLSSI